MRKESLKSWFNFKSRFQAGLWEQVEHASDGSAEKGEPGSLEEKIEDIGLLHTLNKSSGAISLHIPWDIPEECAVD